MKWLLNQLGQTTTWIGFLIVLCALVLPRDYIIIAGVLVIVTDQTWLTKLCASAKAKLEEWLAE